MKKNIAALLMTVVAIAVVSCRRDDGALTGPTVKSAGAEVVNVTFTLGMDEPTTKATAASAYEGQVGAPGNGVVKNLAVFLWQGTELKGYAYSDILNNRSLSIGVAPGNYDVYAMVNTVSEPSWSSNKTNFAAQRFDGTVTTASNYNYYTFNPVAGQGFVPMKGSLSGVSISSANTAVSIPVKRQLSRIDVGDIINGMAETTELGKELRLEALYISNVVTKNVSSPVYYFNDGVLGSTYSSYSAIYESIPYDSQLLAKGDTLSGTHYFYVPHNANAVQYGSYGGAQQMKLVLKVNLGGETCYYPVPLGAVTVNRRYTIPAVTITRRGTDNPNGQLLTSMANFTLNVADWVESSQGEKSF